VKRLLQALALLQLVLVVGLAMRLVDVVRTPLPEFDEIPELPAVSPLPPPRPIPRPSPAVTDAIVEHDLFDEQRGQFKDILVDGAPVDVTPVPPPTTVRLVGVMRIGAEPVGILVDPSLKPEQQSVRRGDMFGEYEVGEITPTSLNLLGGGGQLFQIPLRLDAATPGAALAPATPRPGTPAGAKPANAARPAASPPRPGAPTGTETAEQKAANARERAQAIAQRNAELRKTGPKAGGEDKEAGPPDPVQARLEALRQLREAAKNR
jgi:hypothetical protein